MPDHVEHQALEKRDLVLGGFGFAGRQVPGIECFPPFEVNGDGAPAHQIDERLIRIASFQDGNEGIGPRQHEQEHLGHEGLPAAALRHDQHVGVTERGVEGREGNQLPLRRLEEH